MHDESVAVSEKDLSVIDKVLDRSMPGILPLLHMFPVLLPTEAIMLSLAKLLKI